MKRIIFSLGLAIGMNGMLLAPSVVQNVNSVDRHGNTSLHWAAFRGNVEEVQALLDAGANVNILNRFGNTPLFLAIYEHHEEVADLLRSHGAINSIA